MTSISQLIKSNTHRPVLRLYIKRRLVSGSYETNWRRVDILDGVDQVIDWGTVTYEIDSNPSTDQYDFSISSVTLQVSNFHGKWNNENSDTSYFFPFDTYLTRKLTRIKIEAAYLDTDNSEVGTTTIFEGLIEKVAVSEDRVATINCMSYLYILKQYPISDLAYSATNRHVSDIVNDIFGQSKISDFITLNTNTPYNDIHIDNPSQLDGDYWDVITNIALLSQSVPAMTSPTTIDFVAREAGATSVWNFYGAGYNTPDIFNVMEYDDEGGKRVIIRWEESDGTLYAESSNTTLKLKYLQTPSKVNLSNVKTADRQSVLDNLLAYWESPKQTLTFDTKMLLDQVKVMDKITVSIAGIYPENAARWGAFTWGDFTWSVSKGGLSIARGTEFFVTSVSHDLMSWKTIIKCEKI